MPRIRSIHPPFFTDEDVVEVSIAARLLLIGMGTEADDKGVFEWKPRTLKMRLFPADMIDVAPLLEELAAVDLIRSYEANGKKWGCIRNFRKHQRPKSPNDLHPMPDDLRSYAGLPSPISEMEEVKPPEFPPNGEIPIQMEDGGGEGDSEPIGSDGETVDLAKAVFDRGVSFLGRHGVQERQARALVGRWRRDQGDQVVFDAMSAAVRAGVTDPVPWIEARFRPPEQPMTISQALEAGNA